MDQSQLGRHYFISYSSKDLDIAKQIKEDLGRSGFQIWMDENIEPGTRWDDSIQENIKRSIAVLYLVSPSSRSSPGVLHELELAKIYKRNIVPLRIRGDAKWAEVVAFGLFTTQYIDLRGEMYAIEIERIKQILGKLTGDEPQFTRYIDDESASQEVDGRTNLLPINQIPRKERDMPEDADQPQRNPYKGLHPFEYKDNWAFFGRENLIRDMVQHIKTLLGEERRYKQVPRCMMVVGASGSGKSSLVMAGLLPALEDNKNTLGIKRWFFLTPVRPGEYPIDALAQTLKLPFLNEKQAGFSPLRKRHQADLYEKLNEPDSDGLNELLRTISDSPNERIVLIVDQFEEIFAPTVNSEQREQFVNLLMTTATEPDTPILLLFTLRADFYHRILDNDALYQNVKRHLIDISPMTREELRSVIEKPALHPDVHVTFDPYLAEDLLYEVRQRPESLPLLQFTLEQLFERRDREGRRLTRQSYDEMGGLQGAINKHAEYIYEHRLQTPQHQAEAKELFTKHFIYIPESYDESSHLESNEGITRRRVTQVELKLNDSRSNTRRETIDAFVEARLLTATSRVSQSTDLEKENIPNITYEISHEALISAWERLRQWIKEDRAEIYWMQSERYRIQSNHYWIQSLSEQAKQWNQEQNPKKKKELLLDKSWLRRLQEYRQDNEVDRSVKELFKASLAQERVRKIQRYLLRVFITFVILLLVLGLIFHNVVFPLPPDPTVVTSSADSGPGTLTYALQKASDGATITFDARLKGKTIFLAHNLDINKSITIHGPTGDINVSSGDTGNYIAIEQKKDVTIENVIFTNSSTRKHSIIENAGNLTLNDSSVTDNTSYTDYGGAICNTGTLILNGDILEGNRVSTDGGAIYNLFGSVNLNNSTVSGNEAQGNGGGIYSQGGSIIVDGSYILNNRADNNAGGGIDIVNGSLSMRNTHVEGNYSDFTSVGIGGGVAIVGSAAFITTSVIKANVASAKGGGIVVTRDTDNGSSSLLKLQDILRTDNQKATYFIGQNRAGSKKDDIAGNPITTSANLEIFDDTSVDNIGDPPANRPVEELPNYLGVANINAFCLSNGDSSGQISKHVDLSAKDIMFTCLDQSGKPVGNDFSGQTICQFQYPVSSVIDRLADYFDATSLQCYKNLKPFGSIGQAGFDTYCKSQPQYTGLFDDPKDRQTAYDWLCQPKDTSKLPSGLSVTDACNLQYGIKDAVDRLANYNSIDGWECWEPA